MSVRGIHKPVAETITSSSVSCLRRSAATTSRLTPLRATKGQVRLNICHENQVWPPCSNMAEAFHRGYGVRQNGRQCSFVFLCGDRCLNRVNRNPNRHSRRPRNASRRSWIVRLDRSAIHTAKIAEGFHFPPHQVLDRTPHNPANSAVMSFSISSRARFRRRFRMPATRRCSSRGGRGDANFLQDRFRKFQKRRASSQLHQTVTLVPEPAGKVFRHITFATDAVGGALIGRHRPGRNDRVADCGPARHQFGSGSRQTGAAVAQSSLGDRILCSTMSKSREVTAAGAARGIGPPKQAPLLRRGIPPPTIAQTSVRCACVRGFIPTPLPARRLSAYR